MKPYQPGPGQPTISEGESRGRCFFEGDLVVEGGGFASGRWLVGKSLTSKISGAIGLLLKAKGDGRSGYKMSVKIGELEEGLASWEEAATADGRVIEGTNYQQTFRPHATVPQEYMLPFGAFQPTHRGEPVADAPKLTAEAVRQIGIMISKFEARKGEDPSLASTTTAPFSLELLTLSAYGCSERGVFKDRGDYFSLPGKPSKQPASPVNSSRGALPDDASSLAALYQLERQTAQSNGALSNGVPSNDAASSPTGSILAAAGAGFGGALGVVAIAAAVGFGLASRRAKREACRGDGQSEHNGLRQVAIGSRSGTAMSK